MSEDQKPIIRIKNTDRPALEPGLYFNLDEAIYRNDPAIAQSDLKAMEVPSQFWGRKIASGWEAISNKDSEAMRMGRAFHKLLLEPEDFFNAYYVYPQQTAMDKRQPLRGADFEKLQRRVKSITAHKRFGAFCAGALSEVAMVWPCPNTGLMLKAKTDIFQPDVAVDIKTSDNVSDFMIKRWLDSWAYQEEHYLEGRKVLRQMLRDKTAIVAPRNATPAQIDMAKTFRDFEGPDLFLFIVQAVQEPYQSRFIMIDGGTKHKAAVTRASDINNVMRLWIEYGESEWPMGTKLDRVEIFSSTFGDVTEQYLETYAEREIEHHEQRQAINGN